MAVTEATSFATELNEMAFAEARSFDEVMPGPFSSLYEV